LAKLSRYVRKIPSRRVRSRFKFRLKTLKPSPSLSTYNSQSMIVAIKSRDIAGPANQTKYKIRNRMVRKTKIYIHIYRYITIQGKLVKFFSLDSTSKQNTINNKYIKCGKIREKSGVRL